jgi:hypothetical protein
MVHALTLRTLSTSSLAAQRQGRCTGAHRRGAVAAARGAGAADFSPEELQAAMSKQLKVSAEQAAARVAAKAKAAAAAAPEPAADQASELAQQRRAAREQQVSKGKQRARCLVLASVWAQPNQVNRSDAPCTTHLLAPTGEGGAPAEPGCTERAGGAGGGHGRRGAGRCAAPPAAPEQP